MTLRRLGTVAMGIVLSVSAAMVGGCGEDRPAPPLAPSPPAPAPPASTTLTLSAFVSHTTGRYCEGCTVEVLDGPAAGTSAHHSSGRVQFLIRDSGPTATLRASRDGYHPATQVANVNGSLVPVTDQRG